MIEDSGAPESLYLSSSFHAGSSTTSINQSGAMKSCSSNVGVGQVSICHAYLILPVSEMRKGNAHGQVIEEQTVCAFPTIESYEDYTKLVETVMRCRRAWFQQPGPRSVRRFHYAARAAAMQGKVHVGSLIHVHTVAQQQTINV